MKYKEFVKWCNERACDGCWGIRLAMDCICAMEDINKEFFWQREKTWQKHELYQSICQCISETNKKIEQYKKNAVITPN